MKINYVGKRLLALTLSTAMVMNCGISVFAAETQSETEIVISIPEPEKTIDSFEDYSIDDDGNTIITTTTITEGQDESSSYYEDESSSALIDVKGDLIEESVVVKGNQTYEGEVEADITIKFENMEEGETVSNSSEERETVVGDLKENETDKKYDQTTIIETPKEVEGTLEKVDITRGNGDVEYSDEIENVYDSLKPTDEETKLFGTDNFISNIGLVIGNKVKEHENNADADDTNDAYNVDMTFALAVTVTENDDLIVKVVDSEGKVVRTVRLAGDDSTTNYGTIKPDENGDYVIKGLQLVEGANAFNMKLEGAQHLKEGVYIYTSQDGEEDAEPEFVEVEEGYQIVDLNANVEFNFNVY